MNKTTIKNTFENFARVGYVHLKYKNNKQILMENKYYIIIDDYIFFPQWKMTNLDHDIICFISYNILGSYEEMINSYKEIWFYLSQSQGGAWRYCYFNKSKFEKGHNYTSTTMVHFKLQKYIWKIHPILKIINDKKLGIDICNVGKDFINKIDTEKRNLDENIFKPMRNIEPAKSIRNVKYIQNYVKSELIASSTQSEIYFNKYKNILTEIYSKNKDSYNKALSDTTNKYDNVIILYNLIQTTMNQYCNETFKKIGDSDEIYKHDYEINNCKFESIYKKTTIVKQYGESHPEFDIFFMIYKFTNPMNSKYNGTYNLPLLVTKKNAKINTFGLYENIINTGFYVYKPVEYWSQFAKTNINKDNPRYINDHYAFIGDLLTNRFPFN